MAPTGFISVLKFTSGERASIYNRVLEAAERHGLSDIIAAVERYQMHEWTTSRLDARWSSRKSRRLYTTRWWSSTSWSKGCW
jgi:hypothetical protein